MFACGNALSFCFRLTLRRKDQKKTAQRKPKVFQKLSEGMKGENPQATRRNQSCVGLCPRRRTGNRRGQS